MQHSGKWNTTSQILKPKNIKLRDINGLTSSQIKKMSVRCRSQEDGDASQQTSDDGEVDDGALAVGGHGGRVVIFEVDFTQAAAGVNC